MLQKRKSKQHYEQSDISSYFWVNGAPPETEEYKGLAQHNFEKYTLEIYGLVSKPMKFSLADLRKLPKQSQITLHNCIQGWSGIAEWGGVPLREILKLCGTKSEAKYVVFTFYQLRKQSVKAELIEAFDKTFYEVLNMELATHPQTILAYEMNGEPLPIPHGAPLCLRVETLLGYKQVKYLRSIELVADYTHLGEGQGGFREDFQYYGKKAEM
jgi:DMSO/TMAO reductase YedYZ molybdopterin-dependent catalytic subunit